MNIPLVDVVRQFHCIEDEIRQAIDGVLERGDFVMGEDVSAFEQEFAEYCGTKYAVAVSSGTDALVLSLRAIGIQGGDEVITVPFTFAATVEAILTVGARPVFIDVDPRTNILDPDLLERALTRRTRCIIPVHLFGFPCPMQAVLSFAGRNHLHIIEDASQAHGALYGGRRVGSIGTMGTFSFYPGKNIGAFGEAGSVTTNEAEIAHKIRLMRNHGCSDKYHHVSIGWNHRMDTIQAAVLRVKLRHLDDWNEKRRHVADRYDSYLGNLRSIRLPHRCAYGKEVFHFYVIKVPNRDVVRNYLGKRCIASGVHYPIPLHLQEAFGSLGYKKGDFPVSERLASEVLSLPTFPELESKEIEEVVAALREAAEGLRDPALSPQE